MVGGVARQPPPPPRGWATAWDLRFPLFWNFGRKHFIYIRVEQQYEHATWEDLDVRHTTTLPLYPQWVVLRCGKQNPSGWQGSRQQTAARNARERTSVRCARFNPLPIDTDPITQFLQLHSPIWENVIFLCVVNALYGWFYFWKEPIRSKAAYLLFSALRH